MARNETDSFIDCFEYIYDRGVVWAFALQKNRIGSYQFNTAQLKTIQEVITLVVFCVFSVVYLKEGIKWNYLVGFMFMVVAVFFVFKKW